MAAEAPAQRAGFRIVCLQAENIKRLKAVEITPDDNVVVISGRNGQGKTSILDAIWFGLGGAAALKSTPKPVRTGETDAFVRLDMGDFIVERRWRADKSSLSVTTKDGAKYPTPQAFLDEKLGQLSFDPWSFASMAPKEQKATLLGLIRLPFDLDDLEAQRAQLFAARTDVNRRVRDLEGSLAGIAKPDDPGDELSLESLMVEMRREQTALANWQEAQHLVERKASLVETVRRNVDRLEAELTEARTALEIEQAGHQSALGNLGDAPVASDIEARIANHEAHNAKVRETRQVLAQWAATEKVRDESKALTTQLDVIDARKANGLASAEMPIKGLGFQSDIVTWQDLPLAQCSSAEQLKVSFAMAIALNPTIRVVRIKEGSLLDKDNLALIADMARQHDVQVWIEKVSDDGRVGFVIEDGQLIEEPWTEGEQS